MDKKKGIGVLLAVLLLFGMPVAFTMGMAILGAAGDSDCDDTDKKSSSETAETPQGGKPAGEGDEVKNAKAIVDQVKSMGLDGKAAHVAVLASYGESNLKNIGHGDDIHGVTNGDGSATSSLGLFQQQWKLGWGTREQVMDPAYATKAFLTGGAKGQPGLLSKSGWRDNSDLSAVINSVQGNSDPSYYTKGGKASTVDYIGAKAGVDWNFPAKKSDAEVMADAGKSGGDTKKAEGGDDKDSGAVEKDKKCDDSKSSGSDQGHSDGKTSGKDDFPWKDADTSSVNETTQFFYRQCVDFAMWRVNQQVGATDPNKPKFTNNKGPWGHLGNGMEWAEAWKSGGWPADNKPEVGAVAHFNPGVTGAGDIGHVAVVKEVKGDGKVVIEEYNAMVPFGYDTREIPSDGVSTYLHIPDSEKSKAK